MLFSIQVNENAKVTVVRYLTDPLGPALWGEWAKRFERTLHKKLSVIIHHEHIFPNPTSMRALYDERSLYVQEINHLDNHCVSIGQTSKQRVCSAKGTLKRPMCNILYTACTPAVTAELQLRHKLEQNSSLCGSFLLALLRLWEAFEPLKSLEEQMHLFLYRKS